MPAPHGLTSPTLCGWPNRLAQQVLVAQAAVV